MRKIRADRRRQDDRERRTDAKLHVHRFRHAEDAKNFVQHRHNDRAAADAEQAGKQSGDDTAEDDGKGQPENLMETDARKHFNSGSMTNCASGSDVCQLAITVEDQSERLGKKLGAGMRHCRRVGELAAIGARTRHGAEQAVQVTGDRVQPRALAQAHAGYRE